MNRPNNPVAASFVMGGAIGFLVVTAGSDHEVDGWLWIALALVAGIGAAIAAQLHRLDRVSAPVDVAKHHNTRADVIIQGGKHPAGAKVGQVESQATPPPSPIMAVYDDFDAAVLRDEAAAALSNAELRAMDITVDLVHVVCQEVIGHGPTRAADINEFVMHIHCVQQTILAQAAGRAYPDRFRLLGATIPKEPT